MQIHTVHDQRSGLEQRLMEEGLLCMQAGRVGWSEKQHTKSLLHNASYRCLELPMWLGASLTITSIVLATKPACPSLLSPLTGSKQTDNDQVSQMSTQ